MYVLYCASLALKAEMEGCSGDCKAWVLSSIVGSSLGDRPGAPTHSTSLFAHSTQSVR